MTNLLFVIDPPFSEAFHFLAFLCSFLKPFPDSTRRFA